jgi:electron transfer flavoprotein beta subunit
MTIYVCIKYVPDTGAAIHLTGDTSYDESVKYVINPYDEYAIEEALRIVEAQGGGEVVAVCVGKPSAAAALTTAMGMGADRAILAKTDQPFLDSGLTARALKKAIETDGKPSLVLTGKQSVDAEGMQVPYRLAQLLDMPVVTGVVKLTLGASTAVAERELEGGTRDVIELALPCVVGAAKGLNEPRFAKITNLIKARKKVIAEVDVADLQAEAGSSGAELTRLSRVPERTAARMLEGTPDEMARELVRLLREEARVL